MKEPLQLSDFLRENYAKFAPKWIQELKSREIFTDEQVANLSEEKWCLLPATLRAALADFRPPPATLANFRNAPAGKASFYLHFLSLFFR